ncbi:flippase [Pseudomonas sp. GL-B-12]|uniref:flippase n=1 Tax=Pseudomonas sp. GL-B-12 TaxID=2832374 RepID=UPI001CBF3E1E|nr:flippase [Pseudomonas sp. GL-B-12]
MLNYLAKSLSAVALEKIILLLVALPVNIYIIRMLGPEQYGVLSIYIVLATILFQVSDCGVRNIFISEYSHSNKDILVSTYIAIKFAAALLISAMLLLYFIAYGAQDTSGYYIVICICLIFTFADIFESIQLSELKQTQAARTRLISGILSNLFRFLMIYIGLPPYFIIISYGLEYAIKGILIYSTGIRVKNYNIDLPYTLKILKRALPLTLSMVFLQLYHRVDIFIIKDLMDDSSVGIYSAAMKLLDYLVFIVVVLNTVINPILGREKSGSKLNNLYRNYYFVVFWGATLICFATLPFSSYIISKLYGPEYSASIQLFNVMLYSLPFIFLGSVSGFWYVNNGLEIYALIRNILGLCLNIALNYTLIPHYGLLGAAWATLISYIVTSLIIDALFAKTRPAFVIKITALINFRITYKWTKKNATKTQ